MREGRKDHESEKDAPIQGEEISRLEEGPVLASS